MLYVHFLCLSLFPVRWTLLHMTSLQTNRDGCRINCNQYSNPNLNHEKLDLWKCRYSELPPAQTQILRGVSSTSWKGYPIITYGQRSERVYTVQVFEFLDDHSFKKLWGWIISWIDVLSLLTINFSSPLSIHSQQLIISGHYKAKSQFSAHFLSHITMLWLQWFARKQAIISGKAFPLNNWPGD